MALDTLHSEYVNAAPDWRRMRDVIQGQSAMRRVGASYLRRPLGVTDDQEWRRYVDATPFFEATQRTLEGMTGLAFYRDPSITLPESLADFVKDATQDGVPLIQFVESIFEEIMTTNRVGVLVDHPPLDQTIKSQRDEEASKRRPFVRKYAAEDIRNWQTGKVNGAVVLTQVRLEEVETKQHDEFTTLRRRLIRVLELVQINKVWTYRQRTFAHKDWQQEDGSKWTTDDDAPNPTEGQQVSETANAWTELPVIVPLIDSKPIGYIPFYIINSTDQSPKVKRAPLLGLANTNIAHFNTSGSLENALFWVGNPQPWITGVEIQDAPTFTVGSSTAWVFKDPNAKVGLLSLDSNEIGGLEKRLDRLEQHMAIMGAKMLSADKRAAEAAETARIHRQGEVSVLAGVCGSVSRAITDALTVVCAFAGVSDAKVVFEIFTAFFDQILSLDDALKAVTLWQKGVISIEDLLNLLKKGELVANDRTIEQIVASNQTSPIQPIMPGLTDSSVGSGPQEPPAPPPPPADRPKLTTKPKPA